MAVVSKYLITVVVDRRLSIRLQMLANSSGVAGFAAQCSQRHPGEGDRDKQRSQCNKREQHRCSRKHHPRQ